jgi:hypothetical protein
LLKSTTRGLIAFPITQHPHEFAKYPFLRFVPQEAQAVFQRHHPQHHEVPLAHKSAAERDGVGARLRIYPLARSRPTLLGLAPSDSASFGAGFPPKGALPSRGRSFVVAVTAPAEGAGRGFRHR